MNIESDSANGVVAIEFETCYSGFGSLIVFETRESIVRETGGLAPLRQYEALPFAIEYKLGVVDQGDAMRLGELLCARSDEIHMRAVFEHQAGSLNGVAKTLNTGHAAGLHSPSVHQKGIHLDAAIGGKEASPSRIKGGVVFENTDGGFNGIDGRASARKDGIAGFEGMAHAGLMVGSGIVWNCPGAAMNEQYWFVCGSSHPVNGSRFRYRLR